jgi:chromosome partitioning protein
MKIVAVISTKGGTGKSTLACALAVEASLEASAYLCDVDPQASSAAWWRRRGKPDNPALVRERESVRLSYAIRALQKRGAERDWLICDTPGSFMDLVEDAVIRADAIVLVTQPAPRDLEAQGPALELIRKHEKADRLIIVLNRCDARSAFPGAALKRLSGFTSNDIHRLANRAAYPRADGTGDTAAEISKDAESEIVPLWEAVKTIVEHSDGSTANRRKRRPRSAQPE